MHPHNALTLPHFIHPCLTFCLTFYYLVESAQVEPANVLIEYAFERALEQFGTNKLPTRHRAGLPLFCATRQEVVTGVKNESHSRPRNSNGSLDPSESCICISSTGVANEWDPD